VRLVTNRGGECCILKKTRSYGKECEWWIRDKKENIGDMREIVRGKRIDTGEWAYGYYVVAGEKHYIFTGETGLSQASPARRLMHEDFARREVDKKTVGRHTARKDIVDKMIFDRDIVKDASGNIGVVKYSDHFLDWRIHFYKGWDRLTEAKERGVRMFDLVYIKMGLEIIGNIHDNPELLEYKIEEDKQ
jgi:uncharacterized phage protein (TIGR01671 family)